MPFPSGMLHPSVLGQSNYDVAMFPGSISVLLTYSIFFSLNATDAQALHELLQPTMKKMKQWELCQHEGCEQRPSR